MGGNEDIVLDHDVMADMVAAPQGDVVTDSAEGLQSIVFENEAILADLVGEDRGPGADVARESIAAGPHRLDLGRPDGVHAGVGQGDEAVMIGRRKTCRDLIEGDERTTERRVTFHVISVDSKGDDFAPQCLLKHVVDNFRDLAGPKNYDRFHDTFPSGARIATVYS